MTHYRKLRIAATLNVLAMLAGGTAWAADSWVFAGTYTSGASKGIYVYRFRGATGKLTPAGLAIQTSNPSFLVAHPNGKVLFAVNENGSEAVMGSVSAFSIDAKTGRLSPLNWVSSRGGAPCHLALDRTANWLAVTNYASGSVAVLPVKADGRLGEASAFVQQQGSSANRERQAGPHAHAALFSPDNRFLLVADLGADKIFVYRFDAAHGSLVPNDPPFAPVAPGAGVRHLVFHPNGKVLYAINELASSITVFGYDAARGALQDLQTVSTLPEHFAGASTAAEIAIDAAGSHVYASNRGHDSVVLLAIDPGVFTLTAMEFPPALGQKPRHFALDPVGANLVVASQDSDRLQVFGVHPRTGQIRPRGPAVKVANPVCVVFVPMK